MQTWVDQVEPGGINALDAVDQVDALSSFCMDLADGLKVECKSVQSLFLWQKHFSSQVEVLLNGRGGFWHDCI